MPLHVSPISSSPSLPSLAPRKEANVGTTVHEQREKIPLSTQEKEEGFAGKARVAGKLSLLYTRHVTYS